MNLSAAVSAPSGSVVGRRDPFVSVVVSFYNEEENIPELVRRLRAALDPQHAGRYELIFVNDASTDCSLGKLFAAAHGHHDIRVVNMSRNFGGSVCSLAGMRHAKGDAVIYIDADLQDPPELIPTLIAEWQKADDIDVVYTTRLSRAGEHPIRLWITKWGYRILRTVSEIDLPDNSGDFKLLSRRIVNELVKLDEHKPFLRGLVTWLGFKQVQVFYNREARHGGKSKFPIYGWKGISNFLDSALISFSDVPLKIALFCGFFVSFGAFVWLVGIFVLWARGVTVPGWPAIMATMLTLGGAQLLTIGMMGLYVSAIFRECRKRPNYIVQSTFGFEDREKGPPDEHREHRIENRFESDH